MLFRHLLRRAAVPMAVAAAGLSLVAWALQVVRTAPEALTDATPAGVAARAVLLPLAAAWAFVLPLGAAAGIAVAAHRLAADGVLDTLRGAGIAPRTLAQPLLCAALLAALASAAASLVGEPLALAALRNDLPALGASLLEGRVTPGAFVPVGPSVDLFARERAGDRYLDLLVVRRGAPGPLEVSAAEGSLGVAAGGAALDLRRGTVRAETSEGTVEASFSTLVLPLDAPAVREGLARLLPPGVTAPPETAWSPDAAARLSVHDRYLVLRRWTAPLQTLLFALLAAGVALTRSPRATGLMLSAAALITFALLRLLEPTAEGGPGALAASLVLPHLPLALGCVWEGRRLYLSKFVC